MNRRLNEDGNKDTKAFAAFSVSCLDEEQYQYHLDIVPSLICFTNVPPELELRSILLVLVCRSLCHGASLIWSI